MQGQLYGARGKQVTRAPTFWPETWKGELRKPGITGEVMERLEETS